MPTDTPANHHDEEEHNHVEWCPPLDRRAALRLFSLSAFAAVAAGCGTGGGVSASSNSSTTGTTTTTTLSASNTAPSTNVAVTLTAVVAPTAATGSVTFYSGSTALGTATLASGMATLTTAFTATGTQSLTAVYAGNTTYASSTSAAITITVSTATACSETLEGEEGPYFVDDSATGYNRSNILSNLDGTDTQTGVPLTLTLYVYDSKKSCVAMQGVQVDIWHCNASGIYSAEAVESTTSESWLRGYQITDSTGKVQFTTIVPGWYSGRTTHIHLRLRSTYDESDNSGTNTMQVFFNQTLIDTLATSVSPYSAEGTNPTTNASDHVYSTEEYGTTLMTLAGSTSAGYTASFSVYLPI